MTRFPAALLLAVLLSAATAGQAADGLFKATTSGAPKLQGIDVIAFGPGGALLIGDGKGGQVVAIDTKDTKPAAWKAAAIEKIDEKIAGRLGTAAKNIEITHLAVNRASGKAYLVVRKQGAKVPLIMTVDGEGKIDEFALDKVDFVAVPLRPNRSRLDQWMCFSRPARFVTARERRK